MKTGNLKWPGFAVLATLCVCMVPAAAQDKPSESTSKIKKVLLYNKIGGWISLNGIAAVKETFSKLSAAKGFELVQLETDSALTLDYLKQFQVIVWNNNTNGASSVPSARARQAVLEYLDQGGGWMLICLAGDHYSSWPGLTERMGTVFRGHAKVGRGEVVLDGAARDHGELKWMVQGFPEVFELDDEWLSFNNTVRPLPGVTVVATSRGIPGIPGVVLPPWDGSGDNAYLWAREIGRGRLIYNAMGFGQKKVMEQADSIVPRLYWQNLRYAAGDFQNGCTNPGSPAFDPAARVHVEALCAGTGVKAAAASSGLVLSRGNLRLRLAVPEGAREVRLRDLQGGLVWERMLSAGTGAIALPEGIGPGVYQVEVRGAAGAVHRRWVLP